MKDDFSLFHVRMAINYLGAEYVGDAYLFQDEVSGKEYMATEDQLSDLGRALDEGEPNAYGIWFLNTSPLEIDLNASEGDER